MEKKNNPAEEMHTCPICKKKYVGFGNNALPIHPGRCCDQCNTLYVIPMRMALLIEAEKSSNKDK